MGFQLTSSRPSFRVTSAEAAGPPRRSRRDPQPALRTPSSVKLQLCFPVKHAQLSQPTTSNVYEPYELIFPPLASQTFLFLGVRKSTCVQAEQAKVEQEYVSKMTRWTGGKQSAGRRERSD